MTGTGRRLGVMDRVLLDATDSPLRKLADSLPQSDALAHYWVEDELHPYTEEDRLRDSRFCWLLDNHGRDVARLWMDEGCPDPFHWTEIYPTPPEAA